MIIEFLPALFLGILAGTLTGLSPGIHINLIAALLLSSLASLSSLPIMALVVFITAMSITHTFIDFIPSTFFGAPEEDNFLSVLPAHQLLKKGHGHQAVVLTLYGSLIAIPIILLFAPIFILFLPYFFNLIKTIIPFILIFISFFLIFSEKEIITSLIVFLLAGFIGLAAFKLPVKEPLLPLLTGLFGASSLIISIKSKLSVPKQKILPLKKIKLRKSSFIKSTLAAAFAAPLCSFLPGIGSGHAATIGSTLFKQSRKEFLFLVGSINTIVMGLSFVTAYSIEKTRTGSAAAIKELLTTISLSSLAIMLLTIILSGIISFFLGIALSKFFAKNISKFNYSKLSMAIISILLLLTIFLSNSYGLLVLVSATSLGIFAISSNVRRINLMGSLLVPSIVFYLLN